jgi:hypothetical protein
MAFYGNANNYLRNSDCIRTFNYFYQSDNGKTCCVRAKNVSHIVQFVSSDRFFLHICRGNFLSTESFVLLLHNSKNYLYNLTKKKILIVAVQSGYSLVCEPVNYTNDPLAVRVSKFFI